MADTNLNGKTIVITGASSGFGKGAALEFARQGANVVLAARREPLLEELARECQAAGGQALAMQTDVSKRDDVERLAKMAVQTFGRIDVWINNAGAGALGRFEEVPLEDHIQVIETDLLGTLYGSYYALNQFRQQGGGNLINVASVIGKVPAPYFSSYAAAKHGVVGLSAAIRQELDVNKVENITVCTVMPTSMDTPFFEHAANYTGHKAAPIPPLYEPEQVIKALVDLATNPKDEVAVGGAGGVGAVLGHDLMPGFMEHVMAMMTDKTFKAQPAVPDTRGSLEEEPSLAGAGVSGGWKK